MGMFACTRNTLVTLNILYMVVGCIIITVAAVSQLSAVVTSLPIVGGVLASGVFLFVTALLGVTAALKHHQVMLFFYMVLLFLIFIIQFSVAIACLVMNAGQQLTVLELGWSQVSNSTRQVAQVQFNCCGWNNATQHLFFDHTEQGRFGHPLCGQTNCCSKSQAECCTGLPATPDVACPCSPCDGPLVAQSESAMKLTGQIGLLFSFTEVVGIWLAMRYRNMNNPFDRPENFL